MSKLRMLFLLCFFSSIQLALVGCHNYANSTPSKVLEGDNSANYGRIFRKPLPADVTVLNSAVVVYAWRPGVVTTADFEFELLVAPERIHLYTKEFYLHPSKDGQEFAARQAVRLRPWYAPKPIAAYELYRDMTSVGYVHMLIDRERSGERLHVFISKH